MTVRFRTFRKHRRPCGQPAVVGEIGRFRPLPPQAGHFIRINATPSDLPFKSTGFATYPEPPQFGQSFQTYLYAGEVRLKLQLHRFQLFAEGGAALAQVSTNVLEQVGVTHGSNFTFTVVGGGGLDYHTLNRHFSVGLGADYVWLATFSGGHALSLDAYLRYTR